MRLSTLKIGAAHLRSIAEIAPKSPLVCVNRCPIRNGFVFVPAQKLYGIMQTWPKTHLKRARLQDQININSFKARHTAFEYQHSSTRDTFSPVERVSYSKTELLLLLLLLLLSLLLLLLLLNRCS